MQTLIIVLALVIVGYVVGNILERRHFDSIEKRERKLRTFPATTAEQYPNDRQIVGTELFVGNVVVSLDYFKRVIAGLRGIIGGRIKTYEPLLDRARREAMLRMLEQAKADGFDAVINVRLETSRIANAQGDTGTAGIEMLAFGTGIRLG